ncbi:MAG: PQQ-binding-like beta-propeller repeat protein [Acidobacteria bacterium]|nr:PQQ-binding-like beta-propeller repeat protein [Acidobacteriota bacterium]
MLRRVRILIAVLALPLAAADVAAGQTASRVIRQIDQRCANCHGNPGGDRAPDVAGAPAPATLRQMAPETILQAITSGPMRVHAEGVPDEVKRAMAEYMSGRKLGNPAAGDARNMPNRCSASPAIGDLSARPAWNGWGPDATNARFQKTPGLSAVDVPRLTLKWAFGFPGVSSVYGQPTVAAGRVFIGVDTGYVYSLDAATGCVHWSFLAETGVRNAISIGPAFAEASAGEPRARAANRHAAYFGDIRANVYGVDAATGELLWKVNADAHPLAAITGAPTLHDGRLYVPVSSREEAAGGSLYYPCCTFRGSIVALDAATGRQIWKTYAIADPPTRSRKNSAGTQLWTGAGAAIWHAPTIDPRNRAIYVATGDAYTEPAHRNTDAVMAIHMDTGKVLWSVQDFENDAWLVGCAQERTENCPKDLGPDFDFGAPPILHTLPDGRRLLLAGQKSGQVFAHDPDRQGALVWKALLVENVGAAEILFGGAADDQTAYFGLDNGVLAALAPATGKQKWALPARPQGPRRGFTAALTAIPGVVFAGGQDGMLSAFASDSGRAVWQFNMLQEFKTVNRVAAKGGSMGAPGPTVAGGLLFVGSGYVGLGNGTPGNVLLVFGSP